MRDPHHRKILEGLEGPLDPQLFEDCTLDLLRSAYPRLVPIRGGWDFGRDGAIVDDEGNVVPFLATTQADVLENLTSSLDSILKSGGAPGEVVMATSSSLTPRQRRNLESRAAEKGFTLRPIHDRWDLANRLYRDSRWTLDLLNITGPPPALSSIPRTRRPIREDLALVGRDADLEWLRTTAGDRLIVGQPGSGKTRLMLQIVRDGDALFLASDDERHIAEAYRDLKPKIVIVDDAHLAPERLDRLRHLRERIGADFAIAATAWPSFEEELIDALGEIPSAQVRRLELLTRAQIVRVLRDVGVQIPDDRWQMHELVDQSSNKPGLAVTIGSLYLSGEWPSLVSGEGIRRTLVAAFERVLGHDPTDLLSCFALGGSRGVAMAEVAAFLEIGRSEVRSRVLQAAQSGFLDEVGSGVMAVQPVALRAALLRQVFFTDVPHPYMDLFERIEWKDAAVESLAEAAHRGVEVPRLELRELIARYGSERAWAYFAVLGEAEGLWVLDHYPGSIVDVIHPVLQRAPAAATHRLLELAQTAGTSAVDSSHPLKILELWLSEPGSNDEIGLPNPIRRREIVIEVAEAYFHEGDREIALMASLMALSPRLESSRVTATGGEIQERRDLLSLSAIPRLQELWSQVLESIEGWTADLWTKVQTIIREWSLPEILGQMFDDEPYRDVARRMVEDLRPRSTKHPGLHQALARWRAQLGMETVQGPDEDFQILVPLQDHMTFDNWQEEHERQDREATDLAKAWSGSPAPEVAAKLALYEREIATFNSESWPMAFSFFSTLAREVEDPKEWLKALDNAGLSPRFSTYLLKRIIEEKCDGWERLVLDYLEREEFAPLVSLLVLKAENVPEPLVRAACGSPGLESFEVGGACLRGEISTDNVRRLLRHQREEISTATAVNEWLAEPRGNLRGGLQEDWTKAILRSVASEDRSTQSTAHWLAEILGVSPDLACEWLRAYLRQLDQEHVWMPDKVLKRASSSLTTEQRVELIETANKSSRYAVGWALRLIVDDSVEAFRALLSVAHLRPHHLTPLQGRPPDSKWMGLASVALGAGKSPKEIAEQAFLSTGARVGFGESHWRKWRDGFERLARIENPGLQAVAAHGSRLAESHLEISKKMKRDYELSGSFLRTGS